MNTAEHLRKAYEEAELRGEALPWTRPPRSAKTFR